MENIMITIDIGSTFIKAAVFHIEKEQLLFSEKLSAPPRRPCSDSTIFENNAEDFVGAVKTIIQRCATAVPQVNGLLLSTQQHGCVLCHPDQPQDTYISWQDTRCLATDPKTGKSYLEELGERLPPDVMESTGVPLKPALALCNLYTLFRREELKRSPETRVYTLGSYVMEQLTGSAVCHITNAAPLGFADILTLYWRQDILSRAELDFIRLPDITEKLSCHGIYRDQNISLRVYPDVGDVQTSVYGTGAKIGDLVLNIATSGQLIYLCDRYLPSPHYEVRPYYDGGYCHVISRMPGGRGLDVLIDFCRDLGKKLYGQALTRDEVWSKLLQSTEDPTPKGLQVDCRFYDLPDRPAGGAIQNITPANFRIENLIAATICDFGEQYKRLASLLCDLSQFSGTLYLAGGAILKNEALRHTIIDTMAIPSTKQAPVDEVFSGLYKLAKKCINS